MDALRLQIPQSAVQGLPIFLQVLFNIVATTTLVIWNTFLTLDEEVEFIWSYVIFFYLKTVSPWCIRSHFTYVKCLYFVVRYLALLIVCGLTLGFFGNIHAHWCTGVIWFVPICGSIVTACSNILLIQRVYAFYGRSKHIFWTLCSVYVLSEVSVMTLLISGLPSFRAAKDNLPSPIPELFGRCTFEAYPRIFAYVWFPKLAFEAIAFVCIVARFAKLQFAAWKTGLSNPQLYNVFLRDGIWAFFILFLFYFFTGILLHAHNPAGLSFALWSYTLSSICATRLILNLHHAAKKVQYFCGPSREVTLTIMIDLE